MSKKDSITSKMSGVDHGAPSTRQNVAPPAPVVNVPPLAATPGYGVTGSSTPVKNRALSLLNLRSTKN